MAVARYWERHSVSRKKSDHVDAMTLANILRTDAHMHRPLPADSELVLARPLQDATWRRTKASNELRSLLREYYPGFLAACAGCNATNLASADARAVLAIAPTPGKAAVQTTARIAAALRRAGRQRGVDARAQRLREALSRRPQLRQDRMVEDAMGFKPCDYWRRWRSSAPAPSTSARPSPKAFQQHPDYNVITSFTGLGEPTGARVLVEIGDQ